MQNNLMIDPYRQEPIPPFKNKPPLVRMGGKRYLSKLIVERINKYDYSMYIEPFFGGGRIYFEKEPHFAEIINDKEARVANFFYCCREFPEEMAVYQATLIKDENLFFRLYEDYHNPNRLETIKSEINCAWARWEFRSDLVTNEITRANSKKIMLEHAIDFYFYSNMAFRGSLKAKTMTYFENDPRTETNRMRWRIFRPLMWIAERMRRTQVLNKDFVDIFKLGLKYNNHTRIWYLDPPYLGVEGYEEAFPWIRYLELAYWLHQLPQTDYFILSINDHPAIRKLFSDFKIEVVQTHYTTGGAGQRKDVKELLITPPWAPKMKKGGLERFLKGKGGK